ncbi:MAG: sugar transferase [Oscillospiraceae bacterium]|nr:sugar transferase [Oscillospiraceae bacterium]
MAEKTAVGPIAEILENEQIPEIGTKKQNYKGFYQLVLKRLVDILVCLVALPFVLLVCIPVAILIKVEDGGPIFYSSKRLGKGFRHFGMLKFRSMKVNAPDLRNADGSTYNSKNDPRVTKIGRFLRESSLDELPQFFNVLAGQMSIVGPRAGDVESENTYEEDEKGKLLIRPGITGYTQAYHRNNLSVRKKRLLDAWYAHNVSALLDIKILFRTVKTVFCHENLYTNEEETVK